MTVGEYLKWAMAQPWGWGRQPGVDCCKFIARWCILRGHDDPMDFMKPLYDSERSALFAIERGGGLVSLWTRGMIEAGIPEADDARMGDVGIVIADQDDGHHQSCGIYTGERWAMLGLSGIVCAPADVEILWRP